MQNPFKEYYKESEPDKRYRGYAWQTSIGLQAVDGLKTSDYLIKNLSIHRKLIKERGDKIAVSSFL